jgi:predicted nucleic acid-binding protein
VLKQHLDQTTMPSQAIDYLIDYLCSVADHHNVYYLWCPFLKDSKDDMLLELAVASASQFIITYNQKDFAGIEQFGIQAIIPREFLERIGTKP